MKPAHGRLIVHRSTARWVSPSGTYVLTIFDYARHGGIPARVRKHLGAPGAVVLRVVFNKGNALRVVEFAGLLTVRTTRLYVDN